MLTGQNSSGDWRDWSIFPPGVSGTGEECLQEQAELVKIPLGAQLVLVSHSVRLSNE